MRLGSRGTDVLQVQRALSMANCDSVFGPKTHRAVREFQRRNGLVPDGVVGQKTMWMLTKNRVSDVGRDIRHATTKWLITGTIQPHQIDRLVKEVLTRHFADTTANREAFSKGLATMAPHYKELRLDSLVKLAYFFGQVYVETGRHFVVTENLNYSAKALPRIFKYFRKNPDDANLFGRTNTHNASPEDIANCAYGNRYGNRGFASGDGWRFRGMGAKQTTFRDNVNAMDQWIARNIPEIHASVRFVKIPRAQAEDSYALLTGGVFWARNRLDSKISGCRVDEKTCNRITSVINKHTASYPQRWKATKKFAELLGVL